MIDSVQMTFRGETKCIKINDTFNRLKIIEFFKFDQKWYVKCECSCGNIVEKVLLRNLFTESTKSCGCYNSDYVTQRNFKHGDGTRKNKTRLYKIWVDMHRRCENPNRPRAKDYYAKRITVCPEWAEFLPFKKWALANGYNDTLTIERQNNSKGYSPENCIWISRQEQSKNRTTNHYITFNGKTQTLTDWANELGITRSLIYSRLQRGWSIEKIFTTK